jgi:hydrogenase-4 component F
LLFGGLAIAGAPPFAVFLSEFSIFKAGLAEGRYLAMGLLVFFVAVGFFGILLHVNRMVFGTSNGDTQPPVRLPASCLAALSVTGALVIALGLYLPLPLHKLLQLGATALER